MFTILIVGKEKKNMARPIVKNNITIEGAKIIFRNFSGKESRFNPAGRRNFCVILDPELAKTLEQDGWNVRYLPPRDDDDFEVPYLQVAVNFEGRTPPKIITITNDGKTVLDAESVSVLDWADIENVDLIIRPYNWVLHEGTRSEKRGVKAYLKSMYVTIHEDELERKYRTVPPIESSEEPFER